MIQIEHERKEFARRLAQACEYRGIDSFGKGVTLAKELGVSSKAVSNWFHGESMPRYETMIYLSNYLRVSRTWLFLGIGSIDGSDNGDPIVTVKNVPLLEWSEVETWLNNGRVKQISMIPTVTICSNKAFWLKVRDSSMTTNNGLSIPCGMLILIEPQKLPEINNLVIAKIDETQLTFKKYIEDAGKKYLIGLNSNWPILEFKEQSRCIGVVLEAKWDNLIIM